MAIIHHNNVIFDVLMGLEVVRKDLNAQSGTGYTALHYACERNSLHMVNSLLFAGADTGVKDNYGRTPLMIAIQTNNRKIFDSLANPIYKLDTLCDKYGSALHYAVWYNSFYMVEQLLISEANDTCTDKYGRTPLMLAINMKSCSPINYDEIIKTLEDSKLHNDKMRQLF